MDRLLCTLTESLEKDSELEEGQELKYQKKERPMAVEVSANSYNIDLKKRPFKRPLFLVKQYV